MKKKQYLLIGCFLLLFCAGTLPVMALTADELFDQAVTQYLDGRNEAAAFDLKAALKLDPNHVKARALLLEIEKDLPAPPETAQPAAPTAKPASPARSETNLRGYLRQARQQEKSLIADRLFLSAKKSYEAGRLEEAKSFILQVEIVAPNYFGAKKLLAEIEAKQAAGVIPQSARMSKPSGGPNLPSNQFVLIKLFAPFGLAVIIVLLIKLINDWWHKHLIICSECGTANPKDAEFCKKCGFRLKLPDLTEAQKSWFNRFNWKRNPFTLNIIPDTFAGHKNELAIILEKINTASGHILIIGGLGTGKSTLLQWLEKNLKEKFETIYVIRPPSRPDDLIDLVSSTIAQKTTHTRKYSVYDFQELCKHHKRPILILLDEAHEFSEGFEQFLRTLGDLPNILLVMAGLPQAREKLKRDLPALFDRIVESLLLGSLTLDETKELIEKRIVHSGGSGFGPFSPTAIEKVFDLSCGIPRGIIKIADWVITKAMHSSKNVIDAQDVMAYNDEIEIARPHFPAVKEKNA